MGGEICIQGVIQLLTSGPTQGCFPVAVVAQFRASYKVRRILNFTHILLTVPPKQARSILVYVYLWAYPLTHLLAETSI